MLPSALVALFMGRSVSFAKVLRGNHEIRCTDGNTLPMSEHLLRLD